MPSAYDHSSDHQKKGKTIKSAYDSESFDADGSIHVNGLVGSATISPSGRDIALASPDGLAIIDLDSPYSAPRRLSSHGLPWLVVDVQWSPFAARDYWVASTANHRCLVWNLNLRDDSSNGAVEHSLHGHSRAITDINFSAHHPDILATCSVDGYVHTWDLRRPRQPVLTFCDWFAGATQVKYNRRDPNVLASSHDRWLHIWDDRRPGEPLKSISAHTSKIYGLDWNRTRASNLVTCSLDKSIKFWDYTRDDDVPMGTIQTDFPVWRARHTPFGHGLLAMPQTEPGNLYLYDQRPVTESAINSVVEPTAVFSGHGTHKVKEFLWRNRGGVDESGLDDREFQLVSWGEDNELRLRKLDQKLLESVGYSRGSPVREGLNITRKGAAYKTFRTVDDSVQRDRKSATMSDPRPGSGNPSFRRSALTMGMHSPQRRLGPSWKGQSMKANTTARNDLDRSQLQIGWMKGITMNKRKASSAAPSRSDSKDPTMFAHRYHDDTWSEPETIQEEFVRISNQFPNVKWDNIDMDSLTLNASLKGPWGVNEETIFIKVKVDIPTSYPQSKSPRFYIDKTSFMPDATHKKIEQEIHQLANQFLKRKENCLDVAFSYLLGEVNLETSTSFFKNVRDLEDDDALADESSSEDDDNDIPAGGSASMSQELSGSTELDPTSTLAPIQRPIAPPPQVFTGARFSNDGRLVCFFPTREEKARALFSLAAVEPSRERPKGEPNFAGFGRLAHHSPAPKQRYANDETSTADDRSGESEGTDESSTSSSDSEFTTMNKFHSWYRPHRRFKRALSANDSLRSSGGGTGNGTGTGTGTSRRRLARPKNIVSLYSLRDTLPAKKQLAQEYAIFGDGADVCRHNAEVAEKYGYQDLVDVWKYAALLLRKDIPLELHFHQPRSRRDSILVIARDAVARARQEDEGGQQYPYPTGSGATGLAGRVKWGHHPLARAFINDLFDHFERLADVQMLAMLSCIFGDSTAEDSVAYAESHLTQPETPLPMKAPSFSLEYFPTDPTLWSMNFKSHTNSAVTTPGTAHTPVLYSDSQDSEDLPWLGEPGSNSYSCGETPPKSSRAHRPPEGASRTQPHSLSTSPDSRAFRRVNSTAAVVFAASLPRTLAGIVSGSGSPPEPPQRKRPSPSETILSNFTTSNITWGAATVFGVAPPEPTGTATTRTSVSDDEYQREELVALVPVGVSVVPENQGLFDEDGWMSTPLLDYSRHYMYSSYRYAYSEMLQMWGQPLARLEILKFNVLKDDRHTSFGTGNSSYHEAHTNSPNASHTPHDPTAATTPGASSPNLPLGTRKELLQALLVSGRGLDVTGICRVHETQLDPVEYSRATNGNVGGAIPQTQLQCVYCAEPVDTLYPPCLSCGCASHEACLAEWHAMGETECPAGDECNCVEEASRGQVESWPALQAAISKMRARRAIAEKTTTLSPPEDDEGQGSQGTHYTGGHSPGLISGSRRNPNGQLSQPGSSKASSPDDHDDRDDWESVTSSHGIPTMSSLGGKPPPYGDEPISAAQLSLGNRLKKSLTQPGRPRALRQKSSGIPTWKSRTGV
ncbi:hypothetical protein GQ53DRAFT_796577 [Thozetella sp. PMI_491]|nr:hypothetical protein GQ53DRAFT_796577 [Thozetella sp. PMI_491]